MIVLEPSSLYINSGATRSCIHSFIIKFTMAEDNTLPESLEKLEIDSQSILDSEAQPNLESLTLRGDDCPRESCKCNSRSRTSFINPWNSRHLVHKPVLSVSGSQKGGIIKKSRFKSNKSWILRDPVLKLNGQPFSEDQKKNTFSSVPQVHVDSKTSHNVSNESSKPSSEQIKSQGRIFGACTSVPQTEFSSLFPTKSLSIENKISKLYTATSYQHIRSSSNVRPISQRIKVTKRKKDTSKEGNSKSLAVSDTTVTFSLRQPLNQLGGSQSTTCSQQARMVGPSRVSNHSDDVTIDELASYFDLFVHIPRKMSHMAENMYI